MMIQEEDERICPGCDAPESNWIGFESQGFVGKTGELYCCEACANNQPCECNPEHSDLLVKKLTA